jgi:hypothetical protein
MATNKQGAGTVKYLRVETASADTRVEAAGAFWAGVSEVPLASLTARQVELLKADAQLKVTDTERPAEAEA